MIVLSFWELSKHSATNEEFICIVLSAKKSLRLQKETSGHLKILFTDIWRKNGRILILTIWINSEKLSTPVLIVSPNLLLTKLPKKDVPRLVSLTVETRRSQKPKLYVGDFVRIVKKEKTPEKDTSNLSLTKFLKLPVFRRLIHLHILLLILIKKLSGASFTSQNYN